ncbi:TRAP transporter small permease subunit [Halomonas sp. GT]|uniref:TRAP transporter small permease subunit n=1 Tax=Halomonas sp. GT TaxID=1971364 RepID=UPI0009F68538|nr:TRAP transporter small permease [Halomonas sp. GT]
MSMPGFIVRKVGDASFYISLFIMFFLVISISWEVLNRFLLGVSSVWVSEVSGYLVAGILFMAAGKVYRENGHVGMTILVDRLPARLHYLVLGLVDFFVFVFALVMAWATYDMAMLSYELGWRSSTTLAMPLYLPQSFMPIGSSILAIEAVRMLATRFLTEQ